MSDVSTDDLAFLEATVRDGWFSTVGEAMSVAVDLLRREVLREDLGAGLLEADREAFSQRAVGDIPKEARVTHEKAAV